MRIDQLRQLMKILEVGTFRRASEELHMSQSALSDSVKNLERELGVPLMERNRSGVRLTAVGLRVLPHIQALMQAELALTEEVHAFKGLTRGILRIGTVNAAINTVLPCVLARFHARYPGIRLQVTETGSLHIVEGIKGVEFDLGLVVHIGDPAGQDRLLEYRDILCGPMVVCLPSGHRLLDYRMVTAADVANEPLILFRKGYFMHQFVLDILNGHDLNIVYYTDNSESAKRMIASRVGITVLPQFSLGPDLNQSGAIQYRLLAEDHPHPRLALVRLRRGHSSHAVREFWSVLEAHAVSYRDQSELKDAANNLSRHDFAFGKSGDTIGP
jgi:DNA-binding transcriptional LysR family regulator